MTDQPTEPERPAPHPIHRVRHERSIERQVVDLAAAAMRVAAATAAADGRCATVVADHRRVEVRAAELGLTLRLRSVVAELTAVSAARRKTMIDQLVGSAVATAMITGGLRTDHWPDMASRLRLRAYLSDSNPAGVGSLPGRRLGGRFRLEPAVDLGTAITRPTERQLQRWGRTPAVLWSTAAANTINRALADGTSDDGTSDDGADLRYDITSVELAAVRVSVVTGDQWVTGLLLDLDRFVAPASAAVDRSGRAPRLVSILRPTTIAIFEPVPHGRTGGRAAETERGQQAGVGKVVSRFLAGWRAEHLDGYPANLFPAPRPNRSDGC